METLAAAEHPAWVVDVLCGQIGVAADELARLPRADGERLVQAYWARVKTSAEVRTAVAAAGAPDP